MHVVHNDRYAVEDQLDFADYRKIIGNIVKDASTPLAIGIFGPWGSGKTSLLRMLENDVRQAGLPARRPVWFTAWKYDREEALWRTLILCVVDALRPRDSQGDPLPYEVLSPKQKDMVFELDRLEESIYRTVEWQEFGKWTMDWAKSLTSTTLGAAEVALAFAPGGAPLVNLLKRAFKAISGEEPDPIAEAFSREVKNFRREQLRCLEQFAKDFESLLAKYVLPEGRLIIFVDDLDRCLPEKAVEVLEAIKLFLDVPGCVFVVGMDRRVVERGIEIRYRHFATSEGVVSVDLPISGDSYLQKMIQLPFFLPPLSLENVEQYIRDLETKAGSQRIPEPGPHIFALGLPSNPRQVKRALNVFHVLRGIASERVKRGELKYTIAWPLLIKTIIIQAHFPELYQQWREFPTLVQQLESEYRNRAADEESRLIRTGPMSTLAQQDGAASEESPSTFSDQGLLFKYLADWQKYRPLERLLAFGGEPTDETRPEERQLFKGLSRAELVTYIHLASTATQAESPTEATDADLLAYLLSNDLARVRDAIGAVQEKEATKAGIADAYCRRLVEVLTSSGSAFSTQQRTSAGMALSYLGDPRPGVLDEPQMIAVPAGEFLYGEDKTPTQVKAFHIGLYPVTNAQYKAFVDETGYDVPFIDEDWARPYNWNRRENTYPEGKANYPVVLVRWDDAQSYCGWLAKRMGKEIRLPEQVEWEKAARGDMGSEYPWGDEYSPDKANTSESAIGATTPVGAYPDGISPYGLLDCAGNVLEWTADKHEGGGVVLRGGSWSHNRFDAYCTAKSRYFQSQRENFIGFRVTF